MNPLTSYELLLQVTFSAAQISQLTKSMTWCLFVAIYVHTAVLGLLKKTSNWFIVTLGSEYTSMQNTAVTWSLFYSIRICFEFHTKLHWTVSSSVSVVSLLVKVCPPCPSLRTFYQRDPCQRASPPLTPRVKTGFATSIITVSHPIYTFTNQRFCRQGGHHHWNLKAVTVFIDLVSGAAIFKFFHLIICLDKCTLCSGKFRSNLFTIARCMKLFLFLYILHISSRDRYRFTQSF